MYRFTCSVLPIVVILAACSESTGSAGPVASVTLAVTPAALAVTDQAAIDVEAFDGSGAPTQWSDYSSAASHASYSTNPSGIVTASGTLVTAVGKGTTTLTATIEGKSASVTIVVAGLAHRSAITASESWLAADGPHYVRGQLHVGGTSPVTLTIGEGAQLRFDLGAGLVFDKAGAVLHAVGTAAAPIVMTADSALANVDHPVQGLWGGILISNSQSQVEHVLMSDCGGGGYLIRPLYGCLVVTGLSGDSPRPVVSDLIIENYIATALTALVRGGLGAGSANITITGGPATLGAAPIIISPNEVGTLPASTTLTGNGRNEIDVLTLPPSNITNEQYDVGDSTISVSQTWPNFGVNYVVLSAIWVGGSGSPVLTLVPGDTLRFDHTALFIGRNGAGGLVAAGTAQAPILFTSNYTDKFAASWKGIDFASGVLALSKLDHVVMEAGDTPVPDPPYGMVMVEVNGLDQLITNSTIRISYWCGIARHWAAGGSNTDYTLPALGNSFSANTYGDQCGP